MRCTESSCLKDSDPFGLLCPFFMPLPGRGGSGRSSRARERRGNLLRTPERKGLPSREKVRHKIIVTLLAFNEFCNSNFPFSLAEFQFLLHIHFLHFPFQFQRDCQRKENANRGSLDNRTASFFKIDTLFLCISLCKKTSLESFNRPLRLFFHFRHPRTAHNFHGRMKRNQIDSLLV